MADQFNAGGGPVARVEFDVEMYGEDVSVDDRMGTALGRAGKGSRPPSGTLVGARRGASGGYSSDFQYDVGSRLSICSLKVSLDGDRWPSVIELRRGRLQADQRRSERKDGYQASPLTLSIYTGLILE